LLRWQKDTRSRHNIRKARPLIEKAKDMNQSIGKKFPDFEMADHDAQIVKVSQYAGKFPLIVSFYRGFW
jgi:AhpC/TSA family